MSETTWTGVLDPKMLPPLVAAAHILLDHGKRGDFDSVRRLLRERQGRKLVNWWRPGGTKMFTSLHQAAWHGTSADMVQELVALGAWRALRTHAGDRALDIALRRGHTHLVQVLTPPQPPTSPNKMAGLTKHLAELVEGRIRPEILTPLRHLEPEVLPECHNQSVFYPVPGMYGGFSVQLREHHLYVESWSRVVGGSGQAHLITAAGESVPRSTSRHCRRGRRASRAAGSGSAVFRRG